MNDKLQQKFHSLDELPLIQAIRQGLTMIIPILIIFINIADSIFFYLGRTVLSGLLFVLISSLLWFFGIHGSNVLVSVATQVFAFDATGGQIISKSLFDVFVFMGGCGTTICLRATSTQQIGMPYLPRLSIQSGYSAGGFN